MDKLKNMRQIVERVGDLPAMPDLVAEVLRLTDDPSVDLPRVGRIIERDPSLTAKILRVSNSPYYGMKQYVGTLKLALVILGAREVRNIVLGVTVFDALRNSKRIPLLGVDFWSHCFRAGALAKKLGDHLRLESQGEAFVAGLLHDIGKLVLLKHIGDLYERVCQRAGAGDQPFYVVEEQALGFTHADAATLVAERWNFPKTLNDAIWMHHPAPDRMLHAARDPHLAAVVRVANAAAHKDITDDGLAELAKEPEAWDCLESAPVRIEPEARQTLLRQFLDEIQQSPLPPL